MTWRSEGTEAKAEAWCLLIHADASLSLSLSLAIRGHHSPGLTRRWGPANTAFAVALTTAGLAFTLAQVRGLTRATDLYEAGHCRFNPG